MKKAVFLVCCLLLITFLLACQDDKTTEEKISFNLIAMKDDKYGVINQDGEEVLPFTFNELSNPSLDGIMVSKYFNNLYELINLEGEPVVSSFSELTPLYDQSMKDYTHRTPFAFYGVKNGVAGIYDSKGQHFMDTTSFVSVYDQKVFMYKAYFSLNDVSKELYDHYDSIFQLSDEAYFATEGETSYVIDKTGDIIDEHTLSDIIILQDFVKIDKGYNQVIIYDYDGNRITNKLLKNAFQIQNSPYILIHQRDEFGVIDFDGNVIIPSEYMDIDFKNDLFVCKKNNGFSPTTYDLYYQNTLLKTFNQFNYFHNYGYGHETYVTYDDENKGYYYYQDDEVAGGPYKSAEPFNESGLAFVILEDDTKALINDEFEVVDSNYRNYYPFGNTYLVQSKSGDNMYQWGILDDELDLVVPIKYELIVDEVMQMLNITALHDEEEDIMHYYVISDEEELLYLYDLPFQEAVSYVNEIASFSYEDLYVANLIKLKEIDLPNGYEIVDIIAKDYMIATKDGKYGVFNSDFEIIVPFEYDMIYANNIDLSIANN